jgi:transglutaminase-like putative cysteine protease
VPARVVSGYVLVEQQRFVPHAWVEAHDDAGWFVVDATRDIALVTKPDRIKLFTGSGNALTMGRVLGLVMFVPATSDR